MRPLTACLSSRSMFLRTSVLRPSIEPSRTPNLAMNSSVSSGNSCASTLCRVIAKDAALPFRFSAWYSSGKVTSRVNSSPAFLPTIPSSKPGIMRFWPIARAKPSALPPSNSSPSIEPMKSIVTRLSASAAASTSDQVACCLRSVSSMLVTSSSFTSTAGFSTAILSRPAKAISGNTSKEALNTRSLPSAMSTGVKVGAPAGLIFSLTIASIK